MTKNLSDINEKHARMKSELESKNQQITNYLMEITSLNQNKNQLNSKISELEHGQADATESTDENTRDEETLKMLKV